MTTNVKPIPLADIRGLPYSFQEWVRSVTNLLYTPAGLIPWASVDKTGSNLTDIATRLHNSLQSIQGGAVGDYYHLTGAQATDLTDAGDSTLHFHSADRARAVHTGTQTASTISDFTEASQDATGAMVDSTLVYVDGTPLLTRAALTGAITAPQASNVTSLGSFTVAQLNAAISDGNMPVAKQTEVDFGTTPIASATFTIVDADVSVGSKIIASLAYIAPTGKDLDELEMDQLYIICGEGAGSFDMLIRSNDGSYLADKFKINYMVG